MTYGKALVMRMFFSPGIGNLNKRRKEDKEDEEEEEEEEEVKGNTHKG